MGIIIFLIVGAVIGWIASLIVGADARMGAVANIIVGIIGTFIGGYIGQLVGYGTVGVLSLPGFIFAVLGAVIFLLIVGLFTRKR